MCCLALPRPAGLHTCRLPYLFLPLKAPCFQPGLMSQSACLPACLLPYPFLPWPGLMSPPPPLNPQLLAAASFDATIKMWRRLGEEEGGGWTPCTGTGRWVGGQG